MFPYTCHASMVTWVDNTLTKYRQGGEDGISGNSSISLTMAKNEITSYQILVYAASEDLTNVDVTLSNLTNGSNTITDLYVYKQMYLDLRVNDVIGTTGDWEDQGSNIWRKNIGTQPYVWSGTPSSNYSVNVGFYKNGTTDAHYTKGSNTATPSTDYQWYYDGTYLFVYATSNPASYYTRIIAPNRMSRVEYIKNSGFMPDALIPKVDRFYGETRNVFPMPVQSGKVQGIWVDVGTASATPAGIYTGTATLTADGKTPQVLSISVVVKDFALDSTSAFQSTYMLNEAKITYGHGYGSYEGTTGSAYSTELTKQYVKMMLYNKLSTALGNSKFIATSTLMPWNSSTQTLMVSSWEPWLSIYQDSLDGTLITSGPMSGAKSSQLYIPIGWPLDYALRSDISNADKEAATLQYHQAFYDYAQTRGWDPFNKLIIPVIDEPNTSTYLTWRGVYQNKVSVALEEGREISKLNTGGAGPFKRAMVNSVRNSSMETFDNYGFFDAYMGSFSCASWDTGANCTSAIYPSTYPDRTNLWGYYSCMTNGCSTVGDKNYTGEPDLSADGDALYNRFPGINWYLYQNNGTIYWDTSWDNMPSGGTGGDPYYSIWGFGSNGDGHLIYPGVINDTGRTTLGTHTPLIGGTHDIPIESIRLKQLRDAVQDWEYCKKAEALAGRPAVLAVIAGAFTDPTEGRAFFHPNMDKNNFLLVRNQLDALIENNGATDFTAPTTPANLSVQ